MSVFRSAITDENGDVDSGYLAMVYGLIGWGVSITVVLGIGIFSVWRAPDAAVAIVKSIGDASIGISAGFASMLGAVGLFRMGDKPRAAAPGAPGSTTTIKEKETKVETDAAPLATPAAPMPVQIANQEPVPVVETKRKGAKRGR